jgi:hypothetical protein
VPGYEGNPDAAVGAMAGGGFGSAEGESVEELSADEARRLLEAVERQQLTSHEGRRTPKGPTGERDWETRYLRPGAGCPNVAKRTEARGHLRRIASTLNKC